MFLSRSQYKAATRRRQLDSATVLLAVLALIAALPILLSGCAGGIRPNLIDKSTPLAPRTSHYGFSLPYPYYMPKYKVDTSVALVSNGLPLNVRLTVDTSGAVTSIATADPARAEELAPYRNYLMQTRFRPGLIDTLPTVSRITIQLLADSLSGPPAVAFPVEPNRSIAAPSLYWQSMAERDIEPARLVSFPRYYYEFQNDSFWRKYPFMVFRVELDSTGDVLEALPVSSPGSAFVDQIRTAIHWGEYAPGRVNGRAVASSPYLIISMIPMVDLPAPAVTVDSDDREDSFDRFRVRLVPDTAGVVLPPILKRLWSGPIGDRFHQGGPEDIIPGRVRVDSLGIVRSLNLFTDFWKARGLVAAKARDDTFYPAFGLDGTARSSTGSIFIEYTDESNVRIWFDWDPVSLRTRTR